MGTADIVQFFKI